MTQIYWNVVLDIILIQETLCDAVHLKLIQYDHIYLNKAGEKLCEYYSEYVEKIDKH